MRDARKSSCARTSLTPRALFRWHATGWSASANRALRVSLVLALLLSGLLVPANVADAQRGGHEVEAPPPGETGLTAGDEGDQTGAGGVYQPETVNIRVASPINLARAAEQLSLAPSDLGATELRPINPPGGRPERFEDLTAPGDDQMTFSPSDTPGAQPPAAAAMGSSPAPAKTFQGEQLSGGSIPPDTHGAVGTQHVMTVTNNEINVRTRAGALLQRMSLNAFWADVRIKGETTAPATFDPKVVYDRFNQRYIFTTSFNAQNVNSGAGIAVSATNDPTGTWFRYVFAADPNSTTAGGIWIDFPSIGFNKNWIVLNENSFFYGTAGGGYARSDIFVFNKQAAYAGTLTSFNAFQALASTCTAENSPTSLGCGFTMSPTVVEDNTTETVYLVENWNATNGLLRLSKITGTPDVPILTIGTQFPQSPENWRTNAARIGTTGGYVPQRDQVSYAVSTGSRIMANDARINNAVLRNGSLWTSHHVMVGATPNPPGTVYGTANPDIKTAAQWWQIDPTIETGTLTPPIQRGRIVDPLADNCNSGSSTGNSTERAGCPGQRGQFFFFVAIAVNKNNDVLLGFTQSSPLTYPSGAYAMRLATDPPNTMRDPVVFRSGASSYNIGSGSGTSRQNRWGDYSMSVTDPTNDTDFWTTQEYSPPRTFLAALGGIATPWATWWARVSPNSVQPQPSNAGTLIINEFRFRGPAGILDEYIELYNPSTTTPVRVRSSDASEGWAIARSTDGVTGTPFVTIPEGVVVLPRGHYLIGTNPVSGVATNENLYYSLRNHPSETATNFPTLGSVRAATIDTGYSSANTTTDAIPDNAGIALFNTTTALGMTAATRLDSVGVAALAPGVFKEGAGIPGLPTSNLEYALVRRATTGVPQDTNTNETDFRFVDTAGTLTAAGQNLGAPGPQNVDSPQNATNSVGGRPLFSCVGPSASPNRERDLTPVPNGSLGTLAFRRIFSNYTGQPVRKLRFRIVDTTTFPPPPGTADLRAISSGQVVVTSPCGTPNVTVQGTTLEEPPSQPFGGGFNATLAAGTITFTNPLAVGDSIILQLVTGVEQTGNFRFIVIVEAVVD
ncbi:MAG TPA: hypothetical protein VEY09_03455 [Pyrinomonadaceae bacterium]|nr:hypothetical protein [Pyrinomonadaceae bacterium]